MSADLSTWLTKEQAAEKMGISVSTLERMCRAGEGPEQRYRPLENGEAGGRPKAVFAPVDVDRLAASLNPKVVPPESPLVPRPGQPVQPSFPSSPAEMAPYFARLTEIMALIERRLLEPPAQNPPLYLTIPQAQAFTGLPGGLLWHLVKNGKLTAIEWGVNKAILVSRQELEKLGDVKRLMGNLRQIQSDLRAHVDRRKAETRGA